jgi:hypothetical protein
MKETYELMKTEDGRLWVTVNELMNDIKDALTKLSSLDDPRLIEVDKKEIDAKIIGLHAIYTFLGALQTEQKLIDKKKELERQPLMGDVNIKTVQFDVPVEVNKETLH